MHILLTVRTNSSRLPKKALLKLNNNMMTIEFLINHFTVIFRPSLKEYLGAQFRLDFIFIASIAYLLSCPKRSSTYLICDL